MEGLHRKYVQIIYVGSRVQTAWSQTCSSAKAPSGKDEGHGSRFKVSGFMNDWLQHWKSEAQASLLKINMGAWHRRTNATVTKGLRL